MRCPYISICSSFILPSIISVFLLCLSGVASSNSKDSTKTETHGTSTSSGSIVVGVLLVVVTVILASYFLYKLWQKKKREEQYARLLKLFEEDDELEVELGLRD